MSFLSPVNKSSLEIIIQESFQKFGTIFTSNLIDSLKNLGFHYSTLSGISLSIDDLKIPASKNYLLENALSEINEIEFAWSNGQISTGEKFQAIVNKWELTSDFLKDKLIQYYKAHDPTNSLYLMAFSGARGNISQVRQIIGMRGLMVNQKGSIIQIPILSNFKEGLSNIDYIISSYGARKGIIDTALRTADAGYLTRRLIFLTQEIIIRDISCDSVDSLLIYLRRQKISSLLGRTLVSIKIKNQKENVFQKYFPITEKLIQLFKNNIELIDYLKIKSVLTCNIPNSICQSCYGWDLAKKTVISLGDAVGVIAAHSIGEPGTQLTMRTFHTGGIFIAQQKLYSSHSFTGKAFFPELRNALIFQSKYGINTYLINQNLIFPVINWKNQHSKIEIKKGNFFYKPYSGLIKKGDIIKEEDIGLLKVSNLIGSFLKPIYSSAECQYKFSKNIKVIAKFSKKRKKAQLFNFQKFSKKYLVSSEGSVRQFLGKNFYFPTQIQIFNQKKKQYEQKFLNFLQEKTDSEIISIFLKHKSIGQLKIISPISGICYLKNGSYQINSIKKYSFKKIQKMFHKHFVIRFFAFSQNYQYVDRNTVLGVLYFFPKKHNLIF